MSGPGSLYTRPMLETLHVATHSTGHPSNEKQGAKKDKQDRPMLTDT